MIIAALGTLSLPSGALSGQSTPAPMARAFSLLSHDDPDRPRLGISTRSSGKRDTLGLLVDAVTSGGPADKAGIEEGDRLVTVNGVNLRLSREDAEDDIMTGIATRRLTRELAKHKAGEEVELRVYRDGQTRNVRAKLVDPDDLQPESGMLRSVRGALDDRPVLGLSLGGSGSRRDTLGVLVVAVTDSGPAALAGIEEGDRIASVNGIDLRVDREDAGDWEASSARIRRLNRALEKVKAGDEVELRVYSQGQTRSVRAKTQRAADLRRKSGGFFFDDSFGGFNKGFRVVGPSAAVKVVPPSAPRPPRVYYYNDGAFRFHVEPRIRIEGETRKIDALRRSLDGTLRSLRLRTPLEEDDDRDDISIARPRIAPAPRPRAAVAAAGTRAAAYHIASAPSVEASTVAVTPAVTPAPYAWPLAADEEGADHVHFAYGDGTIGLPGLTLYPVEEDLVMYFGAGSERGLLIINASTRWRGLREGDVILSIDGRPVRDSEGRVSVVFRDGSTSVIELLRGRKPMRVTVQR